jgi:gas vesicle protein
MAENENDRGNFFMGFLFGSVVGVLAGIFFAPKSGKELRSELKKKGSEAVEEWEELYTESKTKAKAILDDAKQRAEELRKEADRQLAEARKRVKEIIAREKESKTGEAGEGPAGE